MWFDKILEQIRSVYGRNKDVPLHAPVFTGREKEYLLNCINSTFVSTVGKYVERLEEMLCAYTGARHAVVTVNGTAALHVALLLAGVRAGDLVISTPLTFVATCNAIRYCDADPIFVDIDRDTCGLSPGALKDFFGTEIMHDDCGTVRYRKTGQRIAACLPVHAFGHPCRMEELQEICASFNVPVVEDAAEALGSLRSGRSCGLFGLLGVLSFNGNKIITAGGGGALLTDNHELARKAKHLTTTAKISHAWKINHDHTGYNYRMPNINAALACAQLEQIHGFIQSKRLVAEGYRRFFAETPFKFMVEPEDCRSNYWLNSVLFRNRDERDAFISYSFERGVQTRPAWTLMHDLPMYACGKYAELPVAEEIAERLVNLPSSVVVGECRAK